MTIPNRIASKLDNCKAIMPVPGHRYYNYVLSVYFCLIFVFTALFISLLYSIWYPESMRDEQHQNLNYTKQGETMQRPRSLPQGKKKALSPSKYLPLLLGGKAAEQRRYCSVQPHCWHRSPTAAWKSWQATTSAWRVWTDAWGIQPEAAQLLLLEETPSHPLTYWASLVSLTARPYSEGCSSIKETSPHLQVPLLTGIDSTC